MKLTLNHCILFKTWDYGKVLLWNCNRIFRTRNIIHLRHQTKYGIYNDCDTCRFPFILTDVIRYLRVSESLEQSDIVVSGLISGCFKILSRSIILPVHDEIVWKHKVKSTPSSVDHDRNSISLLIKIKTAKHYSYTKPTSTG